MVSYHRGCHSQQELKILWTALAVQAGSTHSTCLPRWVTRPRSSDTLLTPLLSLMSLSNSKLQRKRAEKVSSRRTALGRPLPLSFTDDGSTRQGLPLAICCLLPHLGREMSSNRTKTEHSLFSLHTFCFPSIQKSSSNTHLWAKRKYNNSPINQHPIMYIKTIFTFTPFKTKAHAGKLQKENLPCCTTFMGVPIHASTNVLRA